MCPIGRWKISVTYSFLFITFLFVCNLGYTPIFVVWTFEPLFCVWVWHYEILTTHDAVRFDIISWERCDTHGTRIVTSGFRCAETLFDYGVMEIGKGYIAEKWRGSVAYYLVDDNTRLDHSSASLFRTDFLRYKSSVFRENVRFVDWVATRLAALFEPT